MRKYNPDGAVRQMQKGVLRPDPPFVSAKPSVLYYGADNIARNTLPPRMQQP